MKIFISRSNTDYSNSRFLEKETYFRPKYDLIYQVLRNLKKPTVQELEDKFNKDKHSDLFAFNGIDIYVRPTYKWFSNKQQLKEEYEEYKTKHVAFFDPQQITPQQARLLLELQATINYAKASKFN